MAEETMTSPELESRPCASNLSHAGIPGWLEPGMPDWKKQVDRVGIQEVLERRRVYLRGFTDCRGNHWCGHCFWRCRLVNLGDRLGFPALDAIRLEAGYDAWLRYAKEAGVIGIEDAVRSIEYLLRSRGTPFDM